MKRNHLLMLIGISLVPLLFTTTLPYISANRLSLNILKNTEHIYSGESILYVASLQEGNQYTINVFMSNFWEADITIKISDTPYVFVGQIVDENSFVGDVMNYDAIRTGDHYIQISSKSGSGYFDIRIDEGITNPSSAPNQDFLDLLYLLVLILPSVFMILIGIGISLYIKSQSKYTWTKRSYTNQQKQEEKEEEDFCRFCGSKIKLNQQICSNCGSSQE